MTKSAFYWRENMEPSPVKRPHNMHTRKMRSAEEIEELKRKAKIMREDGASWDLIGFELGVSKSYARDLLK